MTPTNNQLTQAEFAKMLDLPKSDTFYISVHTYPDHKYAGFVIIQCETMYGAWCEALRTIRFDPNEFITITPVSHLPEELRNHIKVATPRQVVI